MHVLSRQIIAPFLRATRCGYGGQLVGPVTGFQILRVECTAAQVQRIAFGAFEDDGAILKVNSLDGFNMVQTGCCVMRNTLYSDNDQIVRAQRTAPYL